MPASSARSRPAPNSASCSPTDPASPEIFGRTTALADADADGRAGLVAGDPEENAADGAVRVCPAASGGVTHAADGVVRVCPAASAGVTAGGAFSYGPAGPGRPAAKARFGVSPGD